MADGETKEEFRARMLSIGYMSRTPKVPERIIIRDDDGADKGKRAKVTTIPTEAGMAGAVITESDNRKDCDIRPATHYETIGFMPND